MTEEQVTLAISIGGTISGVVLGTLLGFFLNLWNSKRIEKKREDRNNLEIHFNDLREGAVYPINEVTSHIYADYGYILSNYWESLKKLNAEQFICFKAHYPILADKWLELAGEWTDREGLIGGRFREQNEKVDATNKEMRKSIADKIKEANINLPIKTYTGQEEINEDAITVLIRNIYSRVEGEYITHDFSNAEIIDDGRGLFILKVGGTIYARTGNRNILEKCKSIFADVQNSHTLKSEASKVIETAKGIENELEKIKLELDKIQSRGLISNNKRYKFKPTEQCQICTELFFTK